MKTLKELREEMIRTNLESRLAEAKYAWADQFSPKERKALREERARVEALCMVAEKEYFDAYNERVFFHRKEEREALQKVFYDTQEALVQLGLEAKRIADAEALAE